MRSLAWATLAVLGGSAAPVFAPALAEGMAKPLLFNAEKRFDEIDCEVLLYFHNGFEDATVNFIEGRVRIQYWAKHGTTAGRFTYENVAPLDAADGPTRIRATGHDCVRVRQLRIVGIDACEIDGATREDCNDLVGIDSALNLPIVMDK